MSQHNPPPSGHRRSRRRRLAGAVLDAALRGVVAAIANTAVTQIAWWFISERLHLYPFG